VSCAVENRCRVELRAMSTASFLPWLVVAVLMFWSVGAYNRLVRLRNAILRAFAALNQQFEARHALLLRQLELFTARVPSRDVQALHAACAQVETARLAAKREPGSAETINSLRLALHILAQVRSRIDAEDRLADPPAAASAEPEPASDAAHPLALTQQLAACEHGLRFAQDQFNHAVIEYNAALAQFPTAWLGAMFGFRSAGAL
jgi:LemA protein